MEYRTASAIGLFVGLTLVACRGSSDQSPAIASVNGHDIQRAEFERFLSLKMGELRSADMADSIRSQMLDEYIKRRLVLAEAQRANLSVSDAEIEQAAVQDPQVKSTAVSEEARRELVNDLLIAKYYHQVVLKDVRVSPEEIQQYLEANRARLTDRPAFQVREIRVESREQAEQLLKEVTEGKRDFGEMARLHSHAPTAQHGGFARYSQGQLPSVLEKAIAKLSPGDISPVVESSFGFHIFKLERRIQAYAPEERRSQLDERRSLLIEELISRKNQEAVDQALARILESATVRIHDSELGFTYSGSLRHN